MSGGNKTDILKLNELTKVRNRCGRYFLGVASRAHRWHRTIMLSHTTPYCLRFVTCLPGAPISHDVVPAVHCGYHRVSRRSSPTEHGRLLSAVLCAHGMVHPPHLSVPWLLFPCCADVQPPGVHRFLSHLVLPFALTPLPCPCPTHSLLYPCLRLEPSLFEFYRFTQALPVQQ